MMYRHVGMLFVKIIGENLELGLHLSYSGLIQKAQVIDSILQLFISAFVLRHFLTYSVGVVISERHCSVISLRMNNNRFIIAQRSVIITNKIPRFRVFMRIRGILQLKFTDNLLRDHLVKGSVSSFTNSAVSSSRSGTSVSLTHLL